MRVFNYLRLINLPKLNEILVLGAIFIVSVYFNLGENPTVSAVSESAEMTIATSNIDEIRKSFSVTKKPEKTSKFAKNSNSTINNASNSNTTTNTNNNATTPNASSINKSVSAAKHSTAKSVKKPAANAGLPTFIRIGNLVSSPIYTVGLISGAIDVPSAAVGWWNGSSKPGTTGAVFLDGHSTGVFSGLKNVKIGATIDLTIGNGSVIKYKVVDRQIYEYDHKNPAAKNNTQFMYEALSVRSGSKGLNLMTCHGQPVGNTYSQRLVVFATQID